MRQQATTGMDGLFGVPWECVWILVFPLIAPNTPGKVLLASLGAASASPTLLALSKAVGLTHAEVPVGEMFTYYLFTTYLCAGIAFLITHGILRFGHRLARAREIGSYRLTERLGVGGMGEVWLARHRMLARPAAIKLIRPESLGMDEASRKSAVRRFEREAQATAALRSYHTIQLYDFGVSEEGTFFYVMELLDGLSLNELVAQHGPVPASRAIHSASWGLSFAGGGPRARPNPPRRQAGKHLRVPVGPGAGLREGPGLRAGEVTRRWPTRRYGAHGAGSRSRHASLHGSRDGRRNGHRRPRRSTRPRMRGLLAVAREARFRGRYPPVHHPPACTGRAVTAVRPNRDRGSCSVERVILDRLAKKPGGSTPDSS